MQLSSQNTKAIFIGLLAFLGFSIADALLKNAMQTYDVFFSSFVIFSIEVAIFFLIAPFMSGLKPIYQSKNLKLNLIRGAFAILSSAFFIVGMFYNDLSLNYSVHLSSALWTAILSVIVFKMTLGRTRWLCLIIGFIGVLIVMRPGTDSFQLTTLLPLVSSFSFAVLALATRLIGEREKPITLLFFIIFPIFAFYFSAVLIQDTWQAISLDHMLLFIVAAVLYITAIILMNKAFSIGDTSAVHPTQYSQIIWGILLGYFFFAEVPEIWTMLGAGLIVLSGIYLIYTEKKAK